MISLKQSLGIIALLAVVMACVAITIRPPGDTTNLASGLLFALTVTLFAAALACVIATLPDIDRFWMGFLAAGL